MALLLAIAALTGCRNGPESDGTDPPASPAARDLDALALETGALPERAGTDPAGRYGRRYEGGSDRLCVVPDAAAGGSYRFGAETRIGQEEMCRGTGRARRVGDKLLLRFEGAGKHCLIVARYEGDKIVLPGSIDLNCDILCSSRGSFAGVSFTRIDDDIMAAGQMADGRGRPLCR
ncbi:MAG TPA: hypothetical protein VNS79_04350 [Sphingobium sp.]|nr:hypothetical protein [Sphingobium sp.]